MKKEVETLKNLYEILDETYDCFKDGTVGIEMVIAVCMDIVKQQKIVKKLTNENNKKKGIISKIP